MTPPIRTPHPAMTSFARTIDRSVYTALHDAGITDEDLMHCFRHMMSRGSFGMRDITPRDINEPDPEESEEEDEEDEEEEAELAPAPAPAPVAVAAPVAVDYESMLRPALLAECRKRGLHITPAGKSCVLDGKPFAQASVSRFRELLADDDARE